jgi:chromate transporter
VRAGPLGALLVGTAFVLPSFVMVLALATLYLRYGGLPWMQGAFYGVGAGVIAIIARSAAKLAKMTLAKDALLWVVFAVSTAVTAITESEILWLFLAGGLLSMLVKAPPRLGRPAALAILPPSLFTGLHGAASPSVLGQLAWYFAKAGAFVFGSGLAIVPFLYGGVVKEYHWLTERQFVDAVAVAMITPGPVVITTAFIGFLVQGFWGAVMAAAGTFLPCFLLTILPAPYFKKHGKRPGLLAFIDGATAAAIGAIAGSVVVIGQRSITDGLTALLAVGTAVALWKFKKLTEPVIVVAAAAVGLVAFPLLHHA